MSPTLAGSERQDEKGQLPPSQASAGLAGWGWPAAVAFVFAALCVTGAVAFRGENSNLSVQERLSEPKTKTQVVPAPTEQDVETKKLTKELEFQTVHNRRLEATLRILRDRKAHGGRGQR